MTTILTWYTGKSLAGAQLALDLIAKSKAADYWLPGASRKAKALLSKQNVARKQAAALSASTMPSLRDALMDMRFGAFQNAPKALALVDSIVTTGLPAPEREATRVLRHWAEDFAPVAELVAELDARRPKPVIVCKTLSPSVVKNLAGKLGMSLASVEVPPMEGKWVDVTRPIKGDRYGRTETVKIWHVAILWPAGTRHCRSKFAWGSKAGNQQCEACGHAIRDGFNWCPLVALEDDGKPSSLWVGRDCARKLLECEVDNGEAIYTNRQVATPKELPCRAT